MVICTLYVHITMANFSTLFGTKTRSRSDEIVQMILDKTSCASLSHVFAL